MPKNVVFDLFFQKSACCASIKFAPALEKILDPPLADSINLIFYKVNNFVLFKSEDSYIGLADFFSGKSQEKILMNLVLMHFLSSIELRPLKVT